MLPPVCNTGLLDLYYQINNFVIKYKRIHCFDTTELYSFSKEMLAAKPALAPDALERRKRPAAVPKEAIDQLFGSSGPGLDVPREP